MVDAARMRQLYGKRARGLFAFLALAGAVACGARNVPPAPAASPSYLTSARSRREALEASIVDRTNDYSRLRLARYAADGLRSWDALPEWNPEVAAITSEDAARGELARSLVVSEDARRGSPEALRALGEAAFFRYPVQLMPSARVALEGRSAAERYGLWRDPVHGLGGLVRVRLGDGAPTIAVTCATCHARSEAGGLVIGASNATLDLGRMFVDAGAVDGEPGRGERYLAWGRGRLDVTTLRGDEPVRIPDLRPISFLSHLHHDATLRMRDTTALAIRLETLVIVSNGAVNRPPREIALGLATYLWSLGEALPQKEPATEPEQRGRALFGETCARCHAPPTFTGPPVLLGEIGTDDVVGRSKDRGTGRYRVPSLRGVSTRGPLLHDASVPSIDALFDPARLRTVKGHRYGLDLDEDARRALLDYLRTL